MKALKRQVSEYKWMDDDAYGPQVGSIFTDHQNFKSLQQHVHSHKLDISI